MIKKFKLQKALFLIIAGFILLFMSNELSDNNLKLSTFLLGLSSSFIICGSALFLFPILLAKRFDVESKKVELKPLSE